MQQQENIMIQQGLVNNPLCVSLAPFIKSCADICSSNAVCAARIEIRLPNRDAFHLVVKYWPEERCSSCNEQLLAAARAADLLTGRITAHELVSCRVQGYGNVALSRYAGRSLSDLYRSGDLSRCWLNTPSSIEVFLRRLTADILLELHELEHPDVGLSFRDLKPDNIVWDDRFFKWRLIDYGLAIPLDGSHYFPGMSTGCFPIDLAAINPDDGLPLFCSTEHQWEQTDAVTNSRPGGLDTNVLGLTLLGLIGALYSIPLPEVTYLDHRYRVTENEAAAAGSPEELQQLCFSKAQLFAREYVSYMSDKDRLQSSLRATGLSDDAVQFLLHLLEVDPDQRFSIREAMHHPWVEKSVKMAQQQRAACGAREQEVAAHYAGFGSALLQAVQQHQAQQQQTSAIVSDSWEAAQQQVAALQQQVQQLQQQQLMLQNQLATSDRQPVALPGPLLDKLALAQADRAAAIEVCHQQEAKIAELLQQQLTRQWQQQPQQPTELATTVTQQQHAEVQSQQQQQCENGVTAMLKLEDQVQQLKDPRQMLAAEHNEQHCDQSVDNGLVLVDEADFIYAHNSSITSSTANRSCSDGKAVDAPITPTFGQDGKSPFGSDSQLSSQDSSQVTTVATANDISNHVAAVDAAAGAAVGDEALCRAASKDQTTCAADVTVPVDEVTSGVRVGTESATLNETYGSLRPDSDDSVASPAATAAGDGGGCVFATGAYRLLLAVSSWMEWLDG